MEGAEERDWVHRTEHCFGCGTANELGLGLAPYREGDGVACLYEPKAQHRGFSQVVHGGIIAAVLDEIVTTAVAVSVGALTATCSLQIDFKKPVVLGGRFTVRARRAPDEGSVLAGEGEIVDEQGRVLAKGRGRFVVLDAERAKRFLGSGKGDRG